ncbi:benzoyl-CoA-dihydrodiol lyase [Spiractinospora alimapuensis]|uniref:2,3-epoxybenzoyl-CoA dihydrolase n=1 Tax=Spiractinospora alimapuensis TaxID=2820884 RepID=UPI001F29BC87|nr:2,3-epoxybenzoyl-CoA dihydrolase [Spiractinospora alimapuensis]QVQ50271.1 benzoyl-CoA-dihydrodiol lyase [Spiractinospora alimapuensis]
MPATTVTPDPSDEVVSAATADDASPAATPAVSFDTAPEHYRHWRVHTEGEIAWLVLDVDEQGGLVPGYELKMNSYDLGVDIELNDAVQRLRFEHPEVRAVIVTSGKDRVFSAGANIGMLGQASHQWKVNFCKFTNETRNAMEDAATHSGQTYVAAVNGSCAGGGYEIALACSEIVLVDDNSSTVALPEAPLLGVLPGTGGLTRVVDKRRVRKDRADVFATRSDGVKGKTAVDWKLVDETAPPRDFEARVVERARDAARRNGHRAVAGVRLSALSRRASEHGLAYDHVSAGFDRAAGTVEITVRAPEHGPPDDLAGLHGLGDRAWPLAVTRELDDLVLRLRTNEPTLGTWLLRTEGAPERLLDWERFLQRNASDWFVHEIVHYYKRTLKRLDVTSRSLISLIEPSSCAVGMLFELSLASDRQYILDGPPIDDEDSVDRASVYLTEANFGLFPMGNGLTRLESRFYGEDDHLVWLRRETGRRLEAAEAEELGLVTDAPDDIDWEDEIRLAVETRASISPDALTGMEANHRFVGPETTETKIFGRLAAWQNWVFLRPNASGPEGALRRYGTGQRPIFDRERV